MRKINRKKQIKNITLFVLCTFLFFFVFWILISIIDTNMHNSIGTGYGQYHAWNAFGIFLDLIKGVWYYDNLYRF